MLVVCVLQLGLIVSSCVEGVLSDPPRVLKTPGPPCPVRPTLRVTGNLITFQRKEKLARVSRSFVETGGCLHEGKEVPLRLQ